MKEERLICPTTPKLSHVTERCLKTKLRNLHTARNDTYLLLAGVIFNDLSFVVDFIFFLYDFNFSRVERVIVNRINCHMIGCVDLTKCKVWIDSEKLPSIISRFSSTITCHKGHVPRQFSI